MILPSDYNTAQAFSGEGQQQRLSVGGHICRIRTCRTEQTRAGNTRLLVELEIAEGSEFDGYYGKQFERAKKYNNNPRWNGRFGVNLLNSEGNTNGYFKGFIQAVEESNQGYNFQQSGANEITLQGKFVGFNFGEEEYQDAAGNIKCIVTPRFAVSVARVREGVSILPKKLIADNGASSASQSYAAPSQPQQPAAPYDDDDTLPF